MAAAVASPAFADTKSHSSSNSEQQLTEFVRKLTALRNDVVAGSHPRLKLPAHIGDKGRPLSAVGGITASTLPGLSNGTIVPPSVVGSIKPQAPATTAYSTPPFAPKPASQHVLTLPPSTSGIDPIFLQKSDTLVKAEMQAKRDRLERSLEEQAQMKKVSLKHKTHDEFAMSEFSIDEVLKSARLLVPPFNFHRDGHAHGGATSPDSFDENTFYSSQMNESTSTEGEVIEEPKRLTRPQLCRFFRNDKACPYGATCQYSHDPALRAKVDGPGSGSHVREMDGASERGKLNVRNNSPPRPVPNQGRDDKNDQSAIAEPTSQQQRIAQLEAELEAMKAKEAQKAQNHEQKTPSQNPQPNAVGPDEFGRDLSLRGGNTQQHNGMQHQDHQTNREYGRHNRDVMPPSANDVRIVRNHITSPHAPQPSRVSPLAVAKISQLNQNQADSHRTSRIPYAEVISDGSPNVSMQPLSSKKRRRGRDADEQNRNVVRRNGTSPQIRIKDEPISPPPFHQATNRRVSGQDAARPVYVDVAHQPQDRIVHQIRDSDRAGSLYEQPSLGNPVRRVVSRNGQHYLANDEPDLRRVVSERQMRAPVSPMMRHAPSPYTEPRVVRASSQVYASPTGQRPHIEYRASVQPQIASYPRSPSPVVRNISPVRRPSSIMAPPPRRVLVDQYGNEFLEPEVRQVSMAPTQRGQMHLQYDESGNRVMEQRYTSVIPQAEPRYEQPRPRVEVVRNTFADDGRPSHFVDRHPSPASPTFLDYSRPVQVIHRRDYESGQDPYARQYPTTRVVYQDQRPEPIYEPVNAGDGNHQVQNLRPVEDRYERISRVPSVQPRVIQLTERQPLSPIVSRQAGARPGEDFARPESFARPENYARSESHGGPYRYASALAPDGGYYREVPHNATYETPRRVIERM